MSALTGLADYNTQLGKPSQRVSALYNTITATAGKWMSLFRVAPLAGSAPGAANNPDNTTAGGIPHSNGGSGQLWLPRMAVTNNSAGTLMIADRLLHCSGLSGTVTSPQTVMGNTGAATFTVTLASPGVFTQTAHGYGIGQQVKFTTTGALPTGLTAGTTYFIIAAGYTANTYEVSTTYGGSAVNTSGSQSGTHTATGQKPTTLTRYTDGYGVFAAAEINSAVGTTARTLTAAYTDAEAVGSKTSAAVPLGGSGDREASRFQWLALAEQDSSSAGHSGFKEIDTMTLSASTSTAGDFGIVLFRPLLFLPILGLQDPAIYDAIFALGSNLPEILDNACLFGCVMVNLSGTGTIAIDATTIET